MTSIQVVAALIIHKEKLLIAQRQDKTFQGAWEFPGGKIERGESPEEALKREIMEELEINIQVEYHLTTVNYEYPDFHLKMLCYVCTPLSNNIQLNDHHAVKWIDLDCETESINWVPADIDVYDQLKSQLAIS